MSARTPMRVRGKRSAEPSEKWNHGKQRKTIKSGAPSAYGVSVLLDSAATESSAARKRRQRGRELSRLEQLPNEVLQLIFIFSGNVSLPLVSSVLVSQLAGPHLHTELTNALLRPMLDSCPSAAKRRDTSRLMNSRFFTWDFFKDWIESESAKRKGRSEPECLGAPHSPSSTQQMPVWYQLHPDESLLPPLKLLRPPFTTDKLCMLRVLTFDPKEPGIDAGADQAEACAADPVYYEAAKEAYTAAISEGAVEILESLWHLGMRPETEHLRLAVVDKDCDRETISKLVKQYKRCIKRGEETSGFDFMDPSLWAWGEKAREGGNDDGEWLLKLLKTNARIQSERQR